MKWCTKLTVVVFAAVFAAATAASLPEPILTNYHEAEGVPSAMRLLQAERALDFDGARIVGGAAAAVGAHPHLVCIR